MRKQHHLTLSTEVQIRAFLHRTRMDILSALRRGPATVSQLGEKLGVHPANLTRHVRTLTAAGLVALVEKRDTGRNLEKYYAAVADSFDVAPDAEPIRAPHRLALALARSDLSAALARLDDDDERGVVALLAGAKIAEKDVARFVEKLARLVSSFRGTSRPDGTSYHLNLSLYPSEVDTTLSEDVHLTRTKGAAK